MLSAVPASAVSSGGGTASVTKPAGIAYSGGTTGTLNGTVKNESGTPIGNAYVKAYNTSQGFSAHMRTFANGTYEFHNVPAGVQIHMQVNKTGYLTQYPLILSVTASTTTTKNVTLSPAAYITGTVTDTNGNPVSSVSVVANNTTTPYPAGGTTTNQAGSYSIAVPNGTYDVKATHQYYSPGTNTSVTAKVGSPGTANPRLAPTYSQVTFSGTVVNRSGAPVSGATVTAVNFSVGESFTTTTSGTGAFSLTVPKGHLTSATATASGYTTASNSSIVAPLTGTKFTIFKPGFVNGTVTGPSGNSLQGATVNVLNSTTGQFVDYTSTNSSGWYSLDVPNGTFTVGVKPTNYPNVYNDSVPVQTGQTTTLDVQAPQRGYVNGTLTDPNGNPVSNVRVSAYPLNGGYAVGSNKTNATGAFSLIVPGGTWYVSARPSGYPTVSNGSVAVQTGQTTALDLHLQQSGHITGTVSVPSGGNPSGITVNAIDSSFTHFAYDQTDGSGHFSLSVPNGTYRVWTQSSGYADDHTTGVNVAAGGSTSVSLAVTQPAYINGTVTSQAGNSVQRDFVVARGSGGVFHAQPSGSGHYSILVPSGDYQVSVIAKGESTPAQSISGLSAGQTANRDFTLKPSAVTAKSVHVVSGPFNGQTSKLGVNATVRGGVLEVYLTNADFTSNPSPTMPNDLTSLGVRDNTKFRINVTVENFDPNSLFWAGKNVSWSADPSAPGNKTNVTITATPANLQGENGKPIGPLLQQDPANVRWKSGQNDVAAYGWNRTVYLGLMNLSKALGPNSADLAGTTVTTNAQTFSLPTLTNNALRVWVAAPHRTTTGAVHTGFYRAFIPNSQLNAWGITDPQSQLTARYAGSTANFSVDTSPAGGVWIDIKNIHYSAGYVDIQSTNSGNQQSGHPVQHWFAPTSTSSTTSSTSSTSTSATSTTQTSTASSTSTTHTSTRTPTATSTSTSSSTSSGTSSSSESSAGSSPGFGVLVALVAALAAVAATRWRRAP